MRIAQLCRYACAAALVATGARGAEDTHAYARGEAVTLWLSKVGPYHNPQEVYSYYALGFCHAAQRLEPQTRIGGLGEILEGSELQNSDVPIHFLETVTRSSICTMDGVSESSAQLLAFAVSNHYWYQLFMDELPVWGMVGEIVADEQSIKELESHIDKPHGIAENTYLYTHKNFTIAYNGDRIIEVNMTSQEEVLIQAGRSYDLTYSVHWVETERTFERRFDRYLDNNFFEHQIHWFSLFNSFMMVVFLCGLVALILIRTLKADYARYMRDEEEGDAAGVGDESGWKQVHGDVFRRPPRVILFAALRGTGVQLLLLSAIVILSALAGSLYIDRGAVTKAAIVGYALTSAVCGYESGRYYRQQFVPEPSPHWIRVLVLSATLFPSLVFGTILALNAVAVAYNTTNALSFLTLLRVFVIWAFISLPLNVGGTLLGRRFAVSTGAKPRVHPVPRPVPPQPWYASPVFVYLVAGILPFGSIFIETYFVFTSFWNYKFYYVYGFMLAVFVILAVVTCCVSVVAVYFLLNAEDHRWHWHAFCAGASSALYVFLYAAYYFLFRTEMTGFLQTVFYFGYTLLGVSALGMMTGTIGVVSATAFVHVMFSGIKID